MSGIGITILTVILANLFLGFWVFLKNRKKIANQVFSVMTLAVAIWSFGILLLSEIRELSWALMGGRIAFGGASLIAVSLFLFSRAFPKQLKPLSKSKYLIILLPSLFFILISLFTPFIVQTIKLEPWGYNGVYGKFYLFFVGYFLVYLSFTIVNLIRQFRESSGIQRLQFKYLFLGLIGAIIIGTTTNLIIPATTGLSKFSKLGPIGSIFLNVFTAYAIVKRELFGIKVILTQLLVGIIAVLLLIQVFFSQSVFEYIWKGGLLILFLIFSYLLIKSVLNEIRQREQMEKLAQDLEKANIELKKLDKAKSEFMSIASHQLRTPLTAIKGYISMFLEGIYGKLPEKAKTPMENVYKSNERLIRLVNDLLNVSRIEAGVKLELKKTSVEDIISSVVDELKIEAKEKNIYLKWKPPKKPLPKILIDRNRIRQVILNIIDNSIRYTEKGGVTVKLKIEREEAHREQEDKESRITKLKIIVSDTGVGLTKDELSKMFKSFSRGTAGTRLYTEGVGLGLYIARRFVEMHNGKVWAVSKGKGKGSTFYIELPIK